jgi:cleavage stimulation factor subunit 1
VACAPADRLAQIVSAGLKTENDGKENDSGYAVPLTGIDLDFESESMVTAPEPASYETVYVTSHKGPCRAGTFSPDGSLVATGSQDASIKILDVEKMIAKSTGAADDGQQSHTESAQHPVIRTLYDHADEVTCLEFHPTEQILFSGAGDSTIKIYDFTKPSVKRALKTIQETAPLRCLALHPSGDFLLAATEQTTIRLYDVHTSQCFVSAVANDQHRDSVTCMKYSGTGSVYASCSKDGDIKIWDGVSNRVVSSFPRAHDGNEICSLAFSKNGKYILSSAKDSLVKLWELSMSRCLIAYTGAGSSGKQTHRSQASFNHTEDYVMFPDERTTSLCSWNSRNASRQKLLSLGHNNPVRFFAHSPTGPAFLSCSDDFRARFWYKKPDNVTV